MKILLRNNKRASWKLVESNDYSSEADLQRLLAESPEIIPLDEIRPGSGPLVAAVREFALPVGSIDLLAFTAEGEIAIIECKLSRNTQAKREVIGQILDYAAHLWGMSYGEVDQKIRERMDTNLAVWIQQLVDTPEWDEEIFRGNVRNNLSSGNFLLLIVVNEINEELSRIVQFVNTSSSPIYDFAALEMRRFQHEGAEMLVPRVFGPVRAVTAKSAGKRKWDEAAFFTELRSRFSENEAGIAARILAWARPRMTRVWWGEGQQLGSFVPILNHNGIDHQLFAVYTNGVVEIYFYWYQYKPPFDEEQKRLELADRLNKIKGVNFTKEAVYRRPSIRLELLAAPGALDTFLDAYEWMVEELQKT
jgi:hypothetical protein